MLVVFFASIWSEKVFAENGVTTKFVEAHLAMNTKTGTLRGMHYQTAPHEQAKLVRCTKGAVFDVGIDLRIDSPTYKQWVSAELSADNRRALFLPAGFAHGYQTLEDNSEVFYEITGFYSPESARGVRWNDPAFMIQWQDCEERIIIARDREYPDFDASTLA